MSFSKIWVGSRSWPWRAGMLVALLTASGASAVAADYQESFAEGIQAFDRKRWSDVARHMREAIRQEPRPAGSVKIYGLRYEAYVPHYYLGLALYRQEDCVGAIDAWDTSERYGAVGGAQAKDLAKKKEECRQRLPSPPPPKPPPPKPPPPKPPPSVPPPSVPPPSVPPPTGPDPALLKGRVERVEKRLEETREIAAGLARQSRDSAYVAVFEEEPEIARRLEAANRQAERARQRLAVGRTGQDLDVIEQAGVLASSAHDEFAKIRQRVERVWADVLADRRALLGELSRLADRARGVLDNVEQRGVENRLSRQTSQLRSRLAEITAATEQTRASALRGLRDGTSSAIASVRTGLAGIESAQPQRDSESPPPSPPPLLRNAAAAFLEADYRQVLTLLESADLSGPKARATSHLLLAAANFSLYLEGGSENPDLAAAAEESRAACHDLDPGLEPSPRWFSPGFVGFFQQR